MSAPYRTSGALPPRFVCIACYKTASVVEGTCSRCGSPRVAIDNPDVLDDLRKRAAVVKDKRDTRGAVALGLPLFAVAIGVYLALGWVGWVDIRPHASEATWRFHLVNIPVFVTVCFVIVIGGSLLLTWLRRGRSPGGGDPMTMNVAQLIDFLGATIEG